MLVNNVPRKVLDPVVTTERMTLSNKCRITFVEYSMKNKIPYKSRSKKFAEGGIAEISTKVGYPASEIEG